MKLILSTVLPIVLALVLGLVFLVRVHLLQTDRKQCGRQTVFALLLAIYLILPQTSLVIFRGIPCECIRVRSTALARLISGCLSAPAACRAR